MTRGGHGTLMEASALGSPIIATNMNDPYWRLEELYNIRRLKFIGNVTFIPASDFSPDRLARSIVKLLMNDTIREEMIKAGLSIPTDGRQKAAELIYRFLKGEVN